MTARKVIVDCDPGIDDAVALCLALFDPRIDVIAVTATVGKVDANRSNRNVQTILERLDPPRWPRIGVCRPEDSPVAVDTRDLHGADGLGNLGAQISELHHPHSADKVISDAIRQYPGAITLITLGPLTNIARILQREPALATMLGEMVIVGGCVTAAGNASPVAEFNMLADPEAAQIVFRSPVTKTLLPLDVTGQVVFNLDFLELLPDESTRAGKFLRQVVPYAFRAQRQHLGREGITLSELVGPLFVTNREWFETEEMAGDVETTGAITNGMTVFDRRSPRTWRHNIDVVVRGDLAEIRQAIERGLRFAGQESRLG